MSVWRTGALLLLLVLVAAGLVALYQQNRGEGGEENEGEAPIVAPSRVEVGAAGPVVILDSAEAERIGLETVALEAGAAVPTVTLPAIVAEEPERTAALRAPVAGRLSAPAGARWPVIGERVRAGVEIAQVSDARPLAVPLTGVVAAVGARPGEIVAAGQVLLEVVDRSRPAVRVVWDPAGGAPPSTLMLEPPGTGGRIRASLIGPASDADPLTRRPVYLYRAERAWPGVAPGTPVGALAPSAGSAARGALVPDAAVVQWDGLAWAYRRREAGRYERVAVPTDRPAPGGWIATRGLSAGDTVVTTGVQELLSEEFRARVTVGDESGE